jgi:cytochrome c-type biogenesis protein CcmH/NrfG
VANAIICPACHAQNRPSWEFCARCGEPLEASETQIVSRQQTLTAAPALRESSPRDSSSFWLFVMVAVAVGTVVLACRDIATQPPAPPPTPGVFGFGGPAAASPQPTPIIATNSDVEEARRLVAQGNLAQAIPLLQKAVAEDPGNAEFQHLLGRALWTTGNREGAVRSYS